MPALEAGASTTVSVKLAEQNAAVYDLIAIVDEENKVIEMDKSNNKKEVKLSVQEVTSADLIGVLTWTPGNPSAGNLVDFTVTLKNQGNISTANGNHEVIVKLFNEAGSVIKTFTKSYTGILAAGNAATLSMGSWTAIDGSYRVTCDVAVDEKEVGVKRTNNSSERTFFSGRGANLPFSTLEMEAASNKINGTVLAKNYKLADYAGEASGRSAVYLDDVGESVEFTLASDANAFVLRSSIEEGTSGTISLYINGESKGDFNVTSKYSHVYASPTTLDRLGYNNSGDQAYWLYEDAQILLNQVYPAGTKVRIQKDTTDVPWIYVDMMEYEHVLPAATNPDPSRYVEVTTSKSIEQALNEARMDTKKAGIFIPAGEWQLSSKITVYGRALEIIGAGPWHTKLVAPQSRSNMDIGFTIASSANGSTIKNLSAWGNYQYRSDGPGKFIDGDKIQNVTIENVWAEHFVCLYWGVGSSYNTFKDCRIKNLFADGINMTNGSSYNTIENCYARACGDDAFASFSAIDSGGTSYNTGNIYTNLTAVCTRRAAGFAIYGGSGNQFTNLYVADSLTYPGVTISSLSFGYNTLGFGDAETLFDGITIDRCGGDFYTSNGADDKINEYQNFGAIWIYSGDRVLKNITVKNVNINDAVYFGIMFQTKHADKIPMQNINLENIVINGAERYGIKFVVAAENGQGPCFGSANFKNVKIYNAKVKSVYGLEKCPDFKVNKIGTDNNW